MIPYRIRRFFCAATAGVVVVALTVLSGPTQAVAAPLDSSRHKVVAVAGEFRPSGPNSVTFTWPQDVHAGDCTLYGGASLTLYSSGQVHWYSFVSTSKTFSGDIWHANWQLADSNGYPLGELHADSPTMWIWYWRYRWEEGWGNKVMVSPAIISLIGNVTLYSSC